MRIVYVLLVSGALVTIGGCRPDSSKAQSKPAKNSSVGTVVNGLTGRTAVRAGQRAKEQIEAVSAKRDAELNEVLGE